MPPCERAVPLHPHHNYNQQQQHNMPRIKALPPPSYDVVRRHLFSTRFVRAFIFFLIALSVYTSNQHMMRSNVFLIDEDALNQPENCETSAPSQQQQRLRRPPTTKKNMERVGTFNYMDLYYVQQPLPKTKIHCAGENYRPETSFYYRQCEYQNLCFDLDTLEFVIYEQTSLQKKMPKDWFSSTIRNVNDTRQNLEVSALTPDFKLPFDEEYYQIFAPTVRNETPPEDYYYLDVALIPYYRYHFGWKNPGEMAWQDLLPIWQLIEGFGREDETILLDPLWNEYRTELFREGMADMMIKMGAKLMGMPSYVDLENPWWEDGEFEVNITSPKHIERLDNNMTGRPRLICPKLTLTGNGMVGEHAAHRYNSTHVQGEVLYENENILPLHHGEGGKFRRWRDWMMKNIGVKDVDPEILESNPAEVMLFFNTSKHKGRNGVRDQLHSLADSIERSFNRTDVVVQKRDMAEYTIEEQVTMLTKTKVVMSVVGGGTFPCIFLPPGSHLILFYDSEFYKGGLYDWDYWNNMPHIKTHWIPIMPWLKWTDHHGELLLLFEEILEIPFANATVVNDTLASWDYSESEDDELYGNATNATDRTLKPKESPSIEMSASRQSYSK